MSEQQDGIEERAIGLAKMFHDAYERLAPKFGYETRDDTKVFDPESANGKLMIAVVGELLPETATIAAKHDRLKEALASLLEASRQYELFGLRYNIDFDTQASAESYRRLSDRLGDAQAKAKALIDDNDA